MRIAIIDSGVHADHPHVRGVAGGIALHDDGTESADYTDRLGHGTAVTAVIRALAPQAELFAVRVFHERLSTNIETLVRAIDWSIANEMEMINLSLGTAKPEHETVMRAAVERACARNVTIVAAKEADGVRWLPGSLPGVIPVMLDWYCPWEECRERDGVYYACGYPRPIPGVPVEKNLRGISFAVAHVTGTLAQGGGSFRRDAETQRKPG
jgi:subtilisin family serine protease